MLASFVALAAIHTASAQTVSHITGSTAYRTAVYQAITVAGQLATDLTTTSASVSGVLLTGMNVSLDKDGAAIERGGKRGT